MTQAIEVEPGDGEATGGAGQQGIVTRGGGRYRGGQGRGGAEKEQGGEEDEGKMRGAGQVIHPYLVEEGLGF